MFKTSEFQSLLSQVSGLNKIRLYPAINTHHDSADDSLTLIMVPVYATTGGDKVDGLLYEYAEPCPNNCTTPGTYSAPTQQTLSLTIPTSWCISADVIYAAIASGEDVVGAGNVYGIRFYWFVNANGVMDLKIKPTTNTGSNINDIGDLSVEDITEICSGNEGCCDQESSLYNPNIE